MRSSINYAGLAASSVKKIHYKRGLSHKQDSLIAAIKTGQHQKTIDLIHAGVKIKKNYFGGETAGSLLFFCAHFGIINFWNIKEAIIVADLLLAQAETEERNANRDTPLTCLLKSHLNECNRNFANDLAKKLIFRGYHANDLNKHGNTVLFNLAQTNKKPNIELAIDLGADASLPLPKSGITVLHMIAERPSSKIMEACLRNISNINVRNIKGQTPLSVAVRKHAQDHIRSLMNAGASADIPDNKGKTPLDYARNQHSEDIGRLILSLHHDQLMRKTLNNTHFNTELIKKI